MRNETLEKKNIYYLTGEINSESCKQLIDFLLEKTACNKSPSVIHLIINSNGGDLEEALAVVDVMQGISCNIYTYGIGRLQSAATIIFTAGSKRFITENCAIMTHTYSSEVSGTSNNIVESMIDIKLASERMLNHYKNFCKNQLSEMQIKKKILTDNDKYHTAKEFLNYGMVDEIIPCLQFK